MRFPRLSRPVLRCAVVGVTTLALVTASIGIGAPAGADATSGRPVLLARQPASAVPSIGEVSPVFADDGRVIGWRISAEDTAALAALRSHLLSLDGSTASSAASIWDVAKCVAAVAAFIALTVFPTVRAARLAIRLAGLVRKYGIKKVAKILLRLQRGGEYDKIFKEIALEAAGIGALGARFS